MSGLLGRLAIMAALLGPAGCGAKWTALPEGDQRPLKDYAGLVEPQADVEVCVSPAEPPVDDDPDLLAFTVEVTNWRSEAIRVRLSDFGLRDEEGRIIRPLDAQELGERYDLFEDDAADVDVSVGPALGPTVQFADFRPFRSLRRYHGRRHCFHDRYYYGTYHYWYDPWYYPYGYYYGPGYGGWAYDDAQYERERRRELVRFLSESWRAEVIEPEGVQRGHVLFVYPSERDDLVTLTMTVMSAAEGADEEVASFAFRFARTR